MEIGSTVANLRVCSFFQVDAVKQQERMSKKSQSGPETVKNTEQKHQLQFGDKIHQALFPNLGG